MEKTITLPAGCQDVPINEIPWRIAEALYLPELDTNDSITAILKKVFAYGMPNGYEMALLEDLTDNDWEELQAICKQSNLPPIQIGMSVAEFRPCKKAFDDCKLDWQLIPITKNRHEQNNRKEFEFDHRDGLSSAISNGEVAIYDQRTLIPLTLQSCSEEHRTACMSVKELSRYVTAFDLKVIVGETEVGMVTALHASNTANDNIPGIAAGMVTITKLAVKAGDVPDKQDVLAVEIDVILSNEPTLPASTVKAKLRDRISTENSQIVGITSGGLKWEDDVGDTIETTYKNIDKRIERWKAKYKNTA